MSTYTLGCFDFQGSKDTAYPQKELSILSPDICSFCQNIANLLSASKSKMGPKIRFFANYIQSRHLAIKLNVATRLFLFFRLFMYPFFSAPSPKRPKRQFLGPFLNGLRVMNSQYFGIKSISLDSGCKALSVDMRTFGSVKIETPYSRVSAKVNYELLTLLHKLTENCQVHNSHLQLAMVKLARITQL